MRRGRRRLVSDCLWNRAFKIQLARRNAGLFTGPQFLISPSLIGRKAQAVGLLKTWKLHGRVRSVALRRKGREACGRNLIAIPTVSQELAVDCTGESWFAVPLRPSRFLAKPSPEVLAGESARVGFGEEGQTHVRCGRSLSYRLGNRSRASLAVASPLAAAFSYHSRALA